MESVHFRNGMLNKISNGIHPNYLDLGMMSNKEVSLTYLPFVRLDEQVRLGRGTMMLGNHLHNQWSQCSVDRELNKAFVGFSFVSSLPPSASSSEQPGKRPSLSTGHWGCGAFSGNRVLKILIEWLAAREGGVEEMRLCARENEETKNVRKDLTSSINFLSVRRLVVNTLSSIPQPTPSTSPTAPLSITPTNPALLAGFTQTVLFFLILSSQNTLSSTRSSFCHC
ncbi:putative Poly (ADP-ribose) glycohydrolase (PARG) [Blattamonas nauphoetae]|uniref:Poly (ADP-ribose) glycohydrolase (PARG) n=1 Tax=Blattamonas nauphoetae TaxID=2049346 RepID=A0ABQ9XQ75_9EUKA|nr:putative Poly (ADP-ribose) glycohydrolase (PARG) [Blattamonas nauphoetae]